MKFQKPLIEGVFLRRYKRFFADIEIDGKTVTAHIANSGSLKSCLEPQSLCLVSTTDDPRRKLKFSLEMIKTPTGWAGVNTMWPNVLAWEAWENRLISRWERFSRAQREVKISDLSRIDLVLWNQHIQTHSETLKLQTLFENPTQKYHFVEVKNVTLSENEIAYFPDAVTERGSRHIDELVTLMEQGHTCEFLFMIQRESCREFRPATQIDRKYSEKLILAHEKGLKVSPLLCRLTKEGIELEKTEIPICLS